MSIEPFFIRGLSKVEQMIVFDTAVMFGTKPYEKPDCRSIHTYLEMYSDYFDTCRVGFENDTILDEYYECEGIPFGNKDIVEVHFKDLVSHLLKSGNPSIIKLDLSDLDDDDAISRLRLFRERNPSLSFNLKAYRPYLRIKNSTNFTDNKTIYARATGVELDLTPSGKLIQPNKV